MSDGGAELPADARTTLLVRVSPRAATRASMAVVLLAPKLSLRFTCASSLSLETVNALVPQWRAMAESRHWRCRVMCGDAELPPGRPVTGRARATPASLHHD